MDLNKLTKEKDSKGKENDRLGREIVANIDVKESSDLLDKYLMGEPLESDCSIRGKLPFTLRAPTSKMFTIQDELLYSASNENAGSMAVKINNGLIGLYISKFRDKDFVKDQGDSYQTKEGINERVEYVLQNTVNPIKMSILDEIEKFRVVLEKVFSNENLKNS